MKRSDKKENKSAIPRRKSAAETIVSVQELRERITQTAYELYQKRGQDRGSDVEDWLEAEKLVLARLEGERHSTIKMPRTRSNRSKRIYAGWGSTGGTGNIMRPIISVNFTSTRFISSRTEKRMSAI